MMAIVGLREALEAEAFQTEKRVRVAPLLAEARDRLQEAMKSKRLAELKQATDGEAVDPNKPDRAIEKLQAQVRLYEEAMQMAETSISRTASTVTGLLRGELQRRAQVARAAYEEAHRDFEDATRRRSRASEAAAQATGAATHYPSEDLRDFFANEIAACMDEHAAAHA